MTTFLAASDLGTVPQDPYATTPAEEAAWRLWASGQDVVATAAGTFIRSQSRAGGEVWAPCPAWPAQPDVPRADLAYAITLLRWYVGAVLSQWDAIVAAYKVPDVAYGGLWMRCPGAPPELFSADYGQRVRLMLAMQAKMGSLRKYELFLSFAWGLVLPGQAGDLVRSVQYGLVPEIVKYGKAPAVPWPEHRAASRIVALSTIVDTLGDPVMALLLDRERVQHIAAACANLARAPQSVSDQRIVDRFVTMKHLLEETDATDFASLGSGSPFAAWGSYLERMLSDLAIPEVAVVARWRNLALLLKAWRSVPWPHPWFGDIMSSPLVDTPAFHAGLQWRDAAIAESGYFPTTIERIQKDLADYVIANISLLEAHFQRHIEIWVAEEERKIEEKQKRGETIGKILQVVGIIASLFTAGAAAIIVSLAITTVRTAVGIYSGREVMGEQKDFYEAFYGAIGMTISGMNAFKDWLAAKAASMPAQAGPEAPAEAKAGDAPWSSFVEGTHVASGDDLEALVAAAAARSKKGERIYVTDTATGKVLAAFIHGADDQILRVGNEDIAALMALKPGQAGEAVGVPGGIPGWVLPAAGAALLLAT